MRTAARVLLGSLLVACGTGSAGDEAIRSDPTSPSSPGTSGAPSSSSSPSDPAPEAGDAGRASADAGAEASVPLEAVTCATPAPLGAERPLALPVFAGACPTLALPPALTKIGDRELLVHRPATVAPGEKLPVVFLWHWLGGAADKMSAVMEVQAAVEKHRFVAVIPVSKSDALFRWPIEESATQARVDEEAKFFDDMLACVAAALPVNADCVATAGVSAGALWSAQLAIARSQRISSFVSLSGGVGGLVRDWSTTPHRMPALVLWGGSDDVYPEDFTLVDFEDASRDLETALVKDNHFIVECTHNCGHAVPPFDAPPPGGLRFDVVWRFLLDHPYWLPAGQSPYAKAPLPPEYPSWCAVGAGKAAPRSPAAACE